MKHYQYTDIYLEQGLNVLEQAGFDKGKINLVRQVFTEKMHWSYDCGMSDGREEGVEKARNEMNNAIDILYEEM